MEILWSGASGLVQLLLSLLWWAVVCFFLYKHLLTVEKTTEQRYADHSISSPTTSPESALTTEQRLRICEETLRRSGLLETDSQPKTLNAKTDESPSVLTASTSALIDSKDGMML